MFTESSIAHDVVVYSLVIALGVLLGKIKFFGISLGVTFVLFVGIVMSHFGFSIANATLLNFIRDFGLILFLITARKTVKKLINSAILMKTEKEVTPCRSAAARERR